MGASVQFLQREYSVMSAILSFRLGRECRIPNRRTSEHTNMHAIRSNVTSKSSRIFSQLAMASVSYSGEGYAVVEGVEEDVFNLIFVNSKDSEVLEVEAHILRRAGTGRNESSCSFPNVLCRWIILYHRRKPIRNREEMKTCTLFSSVSVHTRPWVMVEGSVQKVIGLNSLLPDINPARAFTFLTTVFEDQGEQFYCLLYFQTLIQRTKKSSY